MQKLEKWKHWTCKKLLLNSHYAATLKKKAFKWPSRTLDSKKSTIASFFSVKKSSRRKKLTAKSDKCLLPHNSGVEMIPGWIIIATTSLSFLHLEANTANTRVSTDRWILCTLLVKAIKTTPREALTTLPRCNHSLSRSSLARILSGRSWKLVQMKLAPPSRT